MYVCVVDSVSAVFACVCVCERLSVYMCTSTTTVRMCTSARLPLNFKQVEFPVELLLQQGDFEAGGIFESSM